MNREHAFRFLTAMTAEESTRAGLPSSQPDWDARTQETIAAFLKVFPKRKAGDSVYQRLCREPDAQRWAEFKAAIVKAAHEGERTDAGSHARWVAHHLANAQTPITRELPKPVPVIPRPPAAQALWCVDALQRLVRHQGLPPAEWDRLKAQMAEVIAAWGEDVEYATEDGPCPDCGTEHLRELDASAHLLVCTGHPARAELEAATAAAHLFADQPIPSAEPKGPVARSPSDFGSAYDARGALKLLLTPAGERPPGEKPEDALALLTRVGREWAHYIDRASDPCPWCRAVFPLPRIHEHLRTCGEHPARKAAQRVREGSGAPLGLERLHAQRAANRRELMLLNEASARFHSDMGWSGQEAYSDKYSEKPWRAAIARAGKFLGLPERTPKYPRPEDSAVRAAMTRLLASTPAPAFVTIADIETVRTAASQLDEWVASIGFGTTCPACMRRGIPRADLAAHVEHCPLHPAVRAARATAAIEQLRTGVEVPLLLLGEHDPEDYRDRISDFLHREREKLLATLFEFEPSELPTSAPADLVRFVRSWEELSVVVADLPCPWCESAPSRPEHLLSCQRHPAFVAVAPRDRLERQAVLLQFEADQCAVRLARLHEACKAFWNGMSDGEDGKSLSNPRIEAMWAEARKEAQALLACIPERPSATV